MPFGICGILYEPKKDFKQYLEYYVEQCTEEVEYLDKLWNQHNERLRMATHDLMESKAKLKAYTKRTRGI